MKKKRVNHTIGAVIALLLINLGAGLAHLLKTGDILLLVAGSACMIFFLIGHALGRKKELAGQHDWLEQQRRMAQWAREEDEQSVRVGTQPRFDTSKLGGSR